MRGQEDGRAQLQGAGRQVIIPHEGSGAPDIEAVAFGGLVIIPHEGSGVVA